MTEKRYFKEISPKTWEHPADRAALAALKQMGILDEIIRLLIGITTEKAIRMIALSSSVRAGEKQFPKIFAYLNEACSVLDIREIPEIYVTQSPIMNAGAIGVKKPFITINSAFISQLSDDELLAVIGHELGHIASGHVLYKTLLWLLLNLSSLIAGMPVQGIALSGIIAVLNEWNRKSELSADRAGLLVVQEENASFTLLMKMAGGSFLEEMNIDEFFIQASEYEEGGDLLDSLYKIINLSGQTHPYPVLRLKELNMWIKSGDYEKIRSGNYKRRGSEKINDVFDDFKKAADSYNDEMKTSKDPLLETVNRLGSILDKAGKQVGKQAEDFFNNIFKADD